MESVHRYPVEIQGLKFLSQSTNVKPGKFVDNFTAKSCEIPLPNGKIGNANPQGAISGLFEPERTLILVSREGGLGDEKLRYFNDVHLERDGLCYYIDGKGFR